MRSAFRLGAIVVALLAALAPATASAKRHRPKQRCNGEVRLCDRRLNKVVLPATHNSMSARSLGWLIPNQPKGIPAQLRAGIRGFLIDTYYAHRHADGTLLADEVKVKASGLYLCHEYCQLGASPLVPVLRSLAGFLHKHPNNVLVIDQEDYISPGDWASAVRRAGLLHYVYRGHARKPWPTLRTMIRRHQQVVMLAEHRAAPVAWDHLDYEGIVQETPYTFKEPAQLLEPANWPASCVPNRGGRTGSLFLFNHWSPDTPPAHADPAAYARLNSKRVLVGRATACHKARGRWPNLVAVDQYAYGGLFAAVDRLNTLIAR